MVNRTYGNKGSTLYCQVCYIEMTAKNLHMNNLSSVICNNNNNAHSYSNPTKMTAMEKAGSGIKERIPSWYLIPKCSQLQSQQLFLAFLMQCHSTFEFVENHE